MESLLYDVLQFIFSSTKLFRLFSQSHFKSKVLGISLEEVTQKFMYSLLPPHKFARHY